MTNEQYYLIVKALEKDDPSLIEHFDKNMVIPTITFGSISILELAVLKLSVKVVKYLLYNGAKVNSYVKTKIHNHVIAANAKNFMYTDEKLMRVMEIDDAIRKNI